MTTTIRTKSGSTYTFIEQENGVRTLRAENVPSYRMNEITGEHRVEVTSWPPVVGERFWFRAPTFRSDWVLTSTVQSVEVVP